MDKSTKRTLIISGSVVAIVAIAALVWWLTRRRAERSITGTTGATTGGNLITGAVQQIVDTTHQIMQGQYFTINELTRSSTAQSHRPPIDNTPSEEHRANLEALIVNCLDPIRRQYGKPIIVTSGYRSPELNAAVGGVATSQHCLGQAADLQPASGGSLEGLFRAAVQFGDFDQLIMEQRGASKWIHVSWRPINRRHTILKITDGKTTNITNNWESSLASWA